MSAYFDTTFCAVLAKDVRIPVALGWRNAGKVTAPKMQTESDNLEVELALLARVARGDSVAFGEIYDRFSGVLFGLAAKILNDVTTAEDVLQEVFVQIWEKAPTYDPQLGKPLTWAVTLTRNRSIDRLRAAQRSHKVVEAATQEQQVAEEFSAASDESVVSREQAGHVRSALTGLPTDQRQAIELAFFSGLTQTEIATRLNAPLGTVKARIRRGMLQLRDSLQEYL